MKSRAVIVALAVIVAFAAIAGQLATPAFAAGAFNETTMLGWQRTAAPAAMAYVRMPFHATRADRLQPRAGFMITAPQTYRAGTVISRASASGIIDFGFTGRDFRSPWTATFNVSNAVAWSGNPDVLPKGTHHLFERGTSWVAVGAVTIGVIAGTLAMAGRAK
ncbi:MAG: hypothetical protein EXQ84_02345 [Rhodospirillaceae bacterium]|nr:hypothetical protein [Rhodospirillaceae bacterium]